MLRGVRLKINTNNNLTKEQAQERDKKYNEFVEKVTPKKSLPVCMVKAFIVGGAICCLGQFIQNICIQQFDMEQKLASTWCSIVLVFLSVLLTGFNQYQKLARFGGAGTLVPITGFANSVAAPCIEFKKEGQVFGIGCKIFTIAGPVILYGIFSSWVLGIVYWIGKVIGVW